MWNLVKPVVRWPLHSPSRLLGVVVVVAVLIGVGGALRPQDTSGSPSPVGLSSSGGAVAASPSESIPPSPVVEPSPSVTPSPLLPGQTDPNVEVDYFEGRMEGVEGLDAASRELASLVAADAAAAYVTQWAHPERSPEEWLTGLAPYVTARHYKELQTVDPANTADIELTGPPIEWAMYLDSALFIVPTTGEDIEVYLIVDPAGFWLVTSANPVRP